MSKKQYFAILDTETTVADTVADFAIIICDRNGNIVNQCAVLINSEYQNHELFYDKNAKGLWSREYAKQKRAGYDNMLQTGIRTLASVNAVNRWIAKAIGQYNPTLTAYNLAFDTAKCANTLIDLTQFTSRFCLWQAAVGNICNKKQFRQFCVENHQFNKVTEHGNMTFITGAECVSGYLNNQMITEPHTALEDAVYFELPILINILKKKNWRDNIVPYNWKNFQVKDNFVAK